MISPIASAKIPDIIYPSKREMEMTNTAFKIGDRVVDRDGFKGTEHDGARWYDVRFERGDAVRYDADLSKPPICEASIELLRDLIYVAQVVGYDHRVAELDDARLICWKAGEGYIISDAGLRFLKEIGA